MMQEEIGRYIELKRKVHRGEALTLREQMDMVKLEARHREMLEGRGMASGRPGHGREMHGL